MGWLGGSNERIRPRSVCLALSRYSICSQNCYEQGNVLTLTLVSLTLPWAQGREPSEERRWGRPGASRALNDWVTPSWEWGEGLRRPGGSTGLRTGTGQGRVPKKRSLSPSSYENHSISFCLPGPLSWGKHHPNKAQSCAGVCMPSVYTD